MLTLAAFFADDSHLSDVVQLCFIVALSMVLLIPTAFFCVGMGFLRQSQKKDFQFFICHHKLSAGAIA